MKTALKSLLLVLAAAGCQSDVGVRNVDDVFGVSNARPPANPIQTDKVVQVQTPEVDVLYVIDNSCSMAEEQLQLTQNFPEFMGYFYGSGLDYHIGVVSTDMQSTAHKGKLREQAGIKFIDDSTDNAEAVFTLMASMGTGGSGIEKGRDAAYTAIEIRKETQNAGFVRDEAAMHIIVISDEEDSSTNNPISRAEFIEYLNALREIPEMVTFSSIVNPKDFQSQPLQDEKAGKHYIAVTEAVGGIEWDIKTRDWGEVLDQLGIQATGLKREYFLTHLPVEGTVNVWVEDQGLTLPFDEGLQEDGGDYAYDRTRNSITFHTFIPGPLAEVFVEYEVLAGSELEEVLQ